MSSPSAATTSLNQPSKPARQVLRFLRLSLNPDRVRFVIRERKTVNDQFPEPLAAEQQAVPEVADEPVAPSATPPPLPGHLMPTDQTFLDHVEPAVIAVLATTADSINPAPAPDRPGTALVVQPAPTFIEHSDENRLVVGAPSKRIRPRTVLGVLAAVLLCAFLAAQIFVFRGNAQEQAERATRAEESLASTSATLDKTEASLTTSESALTSTKGLLATETTRAQALDLRISELTNEKAQVQDERNVAQEVSRLGGIAASQMLDCRDRLLGAMSALVGGSSYYPNYSGMSARLDAAVPICQEANSSIDAFIGALP